MNPTKHVTVQNSPLVGFDGICRYDCPTLQCQAHSTLGHVSIFDSFEETIVLRKQRHLDVCKSTDFYISKYLFMCDAINADTKLDDMPEKTIRTRLAVISTGCEQSVHFILTYKRICKRLWELPKG